MLDGNLFRSQADSRFNSFVDPMNPVNMNPGNWGIDSSYLTPAYAAPFRPRYDGPYGTPFGSQVDPGFFQSAHAISPFNLQRDNYGGNTYPQQSPYYSSLFYTPADQAMSLGQKWVVPAVTGWAAFKYLNRPSEALGRAAGSRFGIGFAQGLGSANAAKIASAGRVGASIGAVGSGLVLPALAATAAYEAVDTTFFEPYVAQRQLSQNLQRNFAGISYAGSGGNNITGKGLSRTFASHMSKNISNFGANDLTFNIQEASNIADMSSRAGLLDTTTANNLTERITSISRQLKLVMQVANTADFREAVELLSSLKIAGATGSLATRTLSGIGAHASIAGVSTQRLMNTVGAQGQYLFGANGITPYLGQLAAGRAYSSFATAYRSGLVSPELMARLGGPEGATQLSLSGHLSALQTPYVRMLGMNQVMGGGIDSSVVGNVSKFGSMAAMNPIQTLGAMGLYNGGIQSLMAQKGPGFLDNIIHQIASTGMPQSLDRNGKINAETYYAILTQTGMMGEQEARAHIAKQAAMSDPRTVSEMKAGLRSAGRDSALKFMQQNNMNLGIATGPVNDLYAAGRYLLSGGSNKAGGLIERASYAADKFERWYTDALYGGLDNINQRELTDDRMSYSGSRLNQYKLDFKYNETLSPVAADLKRIRDEANKGDKDAIEFLENAGKNGNSTKRRNALQKLSRKMPLWNEEALIKEVDSSLVALSKVDTRDSSLMSDLKNRTDYAGKLDSRRDSLFKDLFGKNTQLMPGSSAMERIYAGELLSRQFEDDWDWDSQRGKETIAALASSGIGHKLGLFDKSGVLDHKKAKVLGDLQVGSNINAGIGTFQGFFESTGLTPKQISELVKSGKAREMLSEQDRAIWDKDSAGRSQIDSEYQFFSLKAREKGLNLGDKFTNVNEYTEAKDLLNHNEAQQVRNREALQIEQLRDSGKIDWTTYKDMQATLKFEAAVENFGKIVDGMKGTPGSVGSPLQEANLSSPGSFVYGLAQSFLRK